MLKKVRSETEKRQEEAKALRERRERQKQARLMAARQRQRARLGLPPIEINGIEELEFKEEVKETKEEEKEDTTREMLEVALKKAAHVRPWDIGKDGVKKPVMTQEEWVEMKRDERMDEFAPSYEQKKQELASSKPIKKKKRKLFNQPDIQQTFEPSCSNILVSNATSSDNTEENFPKRRGVAIPPPPSFDYYNPSSNRNSKLKKPVLNNLGTEEAIEAGLKYLREQYESKATDEKGLLDII
ncbi:hypothetical protein AAG570_010962 [Ranatra chinensis]|uniref:Uncharacterized protein n=1 Tax=Ranatra chinensis TaxID=642074 RepID=A0ABD0YLC5_9HEMI